MITSEVCSFADSVVAYTFTVDCEEEINFFQPILGNYQLLMIFFPLRNVLHLYSFQIILLLCLTRRNSAI